MCFHEINRGTPIRRSSHFQVGERLVYVDKYTTVNLINSLHKSELKKTERERESKSERDRDGG